jgi:hypothetical protein
MAPSCSRPLAVMSAGRQAGSHCHPTRKLGISSRKELTAALPDLGAAATATALA